MELAKIKDNQWNAVRKIYTEAFPKKEQKTFTSLKSSVKKGKTKLLTASENDTLLGFTALIPYKDMVMVDYLAVNSAIRSKGTGSRILQNVCNLYSNKKIVLLIEQIDKMAENNQQRIARRKFYLRNGFTSSDIYISGVSGNMEVLNYGGKVSAKEYMELQKYALGKIFFLFSGIRLVK